jgi:diamine N-acetyltransferase
VNVTIRAAAPGDTSSVFALVKELADYERLSHQVDASPERIAAALFGPQPRLFCDIAEADGQAAGFAMWFLNYSSFRGRHGLYLEDLFVRPAFRGRGLGKALMRSLAKRCVDNGYARFEWAVLDWNTPAIDFYRSIGARVLDDWRICRMTDDALTQFAGRSS